MRKVLMIIYFLLRLVILIGVALINVHHLNCALSSGA